MTEVKVFTFNVNELNKNFNNIDTNEMVIKLTELFNPSVSTVYFISTQEDKYNSTFLNIIKKKVFGGKNFIKKHYVITSLAQVVGKSYQIHGLVIYSNQLKEYNYRVKGHKIFIHNPARSKGTIIIKFGNDNENIYFLCSHLPMSSKNLSMGYEKRLKVFNKIIGYLKPKIEEDRKKSKASHMLWTGDLNFRIEPDVYDPDEQIEQLIDGIIPTINQKYKINLKDLSQIDKYLPTCKTVIDEEKITCTATCENRSCNKCYQVKTKKGKRIPSYCDRVVGWSSQGEIVNFSTQTLYATEFDFVKYSDHNPIMTTIILPNISDNNFMYNNPLINRRRRNSEYQLPRRYNEDISTPLIYNNNEGDESPLTINSEEFNPQFLEQTPRSALVDNSEVTSDETPLATPIRTPLIYKNENEEDNEVDEVANLYQNGGNVNKAKKYKLKIEYIKNNKLKK